ncbi:MAG TPA: nickel pincer cofactor biosynthesis protein LarC [Terriglobales bacterium]|nr:nickel pincer cofactor biosynthesis protein LarC [Terriglobales bacterium]
MRIAYLDCFSGISGDMFMGAMVDAGVSPKLLEDTVAALNIGARLEISKVKRGGISGTKVDVYANGEKDLPRETFWEQKHDHSHEHIDAHSHGDGHKHSHEHSHDHSHSEPAGHVHGSTHHEHARGLAEIREIIEKSAISPTAKATAIRIFVALGEAEAEIHGTSIDHVHFHEVGAIDAMVDIVCAAAGAESLAVDEWICSPLNVGSGTVKCAHGTLPVPAPATLRLLKDAPIYSSGPQVELVTPTGAAIVKTLASRFATFPAMKIDHSGYGAGTRDFPNHPNLLRLTIGEAMPAPAASSSQTQSHLGPANAGLPTEGLANETITVLEANLDDLSPQVLAYAMERLLAEGALDVFSVPVQMKKSRPGAVLTVLAKTEDANRLTKTIFSETTTLGVRRRDEQRQTLSRRWQTVDTTWGPVRMKIANMNGSVSNYAPEYEDCRALAEAKQVPLRNVMQEAIQRYLASAHK